MIPTYGADLFSDESLDHPYGHLRNLRDLGPLVWLDAHDVFVVSRYAEAREVLGHPEVFCSGQGVGLNEFINTAGQGTTLMSDGTQHEKLRSVIGRPLTPKALAALRDEAEVLAAGVADRLVQACSFDAVTDLAEVIPSTWVPDLLGWPAEGRDRLLEWAAATFDGLGPLNERTVAAATGLLEMSSYAQEVASSPLPPDSMGAGIVDAAKRGEIEWAQCPMAFIDYLGPSLDTTIAAIGNAIWLFATHPDQWALLRRDPDRVKQAFNEVLRFESPISGFTRVATRTTEIGGEELPAGARVLVSFASANRDERQWHAPDQFDITRNSAGHVGFGYGPHACVGMGLARLEASAVLGALVARVDRFDLDGTPVRRLNNLIRSFASLPMRIQAA